MVANLSDDDIWRLNRGGHDPHKVYAAYHQAVNTKGMPTVILAKTVKGYGMGAAGESLNPTHQTKKLDDEAVRTFRDRFNIPVTDAQLADGAGAVLPPGRGLAGSAVPEGAPRRAGRLPAAAPPQVQRVVRDAEAGSVRPSAEVHRRARDLHHHGLRADAQHRPARQADRSAHRADRRRRGAHVRHGRHVPPDRHLRAVRAEVQAGRCRPADVLPRGPVRPGAAAGHQRAGRDVVVDGRGHQLFGQQRADAAVLHLLLHVRLPAHRRHRLAGGGHAHARLPAGRHRRAHHAQRRGPAARGRLQPRASPAPSPTAAATTRPSVSRSRWSCSTACRR